MWRSSSGRHIFCVTSLNGLRRELEKVAHMESRVRNPNAQSLSDPTVRDALGDFVTSYKSEVHGASAVAWAAAAAGFLLILVVAVRQDTFGLMLCGFLAVIALGSGMVYWRSRIGLRADLHKNGLALHSGRKCRLLPFEGIKEMRDIPHFGETLAGEPKFEPDAWSYEIVHRDGSRCSLAGFEDVRELGDRVGRIVADIRFDRAIEKLAMGEHLDFGRVTAFGDVIVEGTAGVDWEDIESVEVNGRGEFVIHSYSTPSPPIRVPVQHVANVRLLLKLIDQSCRRAGRTGS